MYARWPDWSIITVAALCGLVAIAWPRMRHYQLTGQFNPIERIETLQVTNVTKGWTVDGLQLADGRTIQLPGFRQLPETSDALAEVISNGIEVSTNGTIYGLVRVHHWCGNDPVRKHIAKVDVAKMLGFLGEGELASDRKGSIDPAAQRPARFSQWGWNVSDYISFKSWSVLSDDTLNRMTREAGKDKTTAH